jgi:hypothetical protein
VRMKTSSVLHPSYPISIQPTYIIGLDSEVGVNLVRPYSHPLTFDGPTTSNLPNSP